MSNISSTHTFVKLDRNTAPLSGQRLARVIAKASRNGEYPSANLTESLGVSVPFLTEDEIVNHIDVLMPHVRSWLTTVQDAVIREFRIEHGRNEIPQDAIGISALVAHLDSNLAGDRVTKEFLCEWFLESYAHVASQYVSQIMQIPADSDKVSEKVRVLRDMFSVWASPKASPNIPTLKAQIRFMETCVSNECADARMVAILSRAQTMLEKKQNELSADALGF